MGSSTLPRYGTTPNKDNTGRIINMTFDSPVYGTTITVAPNSSKHIVKVGILTGNVSIFAALADAFVGDKVEILLVADNINRIASFSTGFAVTPPISVLSNKRATITFLFDGVKYVEASRGIEA